MIKRIEPNKVSKVIDTAIESAIESLSLSMQEAIGQDDGRVAEVFWAGAYEEEFYKVLRPMMKDYLEFEYLYIPKVESYKIEVEPSLDSLVELILPTDLYGSLKPCPDADPSSKTSAAAAADEVIITALAPVPSKTPPRKTIVWRRLSDGKYLIQTRTISFGSGISYSHTSDINKASTSPMISWRLEGLRREDYKMVHVEVHREVKEISTVRKYMCDACGTKEPCKVEITNSNNSDDVFYNQVCLLNSDNKLETNWRLYS